MSNATHVAKIEETVARQRAFFQTGATRPVAVRVAALDTLFLMALIINKGKWLLVAFLPLWYNGRRYHPYTGTERGCATMSIFSSFLLSVLASVVAYYICKWLDGDK